MPLSERAFGVLRFLIIGVAFIQTSFFFRDVSNWIPQAWTWLFNMYHVYHQRKIVLPNPLVHQPPSHSQLFIGHKAAICSDSAICSEIGTQIFHKGGSAVDAAIATLFCNGLVAMQSMGLGGGMIMNVYNHGKKASTTIVAREVAPRHVVAEDYDYCGNTTELFHSPLSIAVPTELMGYAEAHKAYGSLEWSALVMPTVSLCYSGYVVTKHQRDALDMNREMVLEDQHLRKMFYDESRQMFLPAGSKVKPPLQLCHTLETIAAEGPSTFYTGSLSKDVLKDLQEMGSPIRQDDFTYLCAEVQKSVKVPLDKYTLHLTPPPSSGHILGFIMKVLGKFRGDFIKAKSMGGKEMHRIIETLKFAFAKRWSMDVDIYKEFLDDLTSDEVTKEIANLILDSTTHQTLYYGPHPEARYYKEYGTAHISVMAPNGDAVSVTSSINFYFGSGRTGKRSGILFNNAMADFSVEGVPNYFDLPNVPGKNRIRPAHSPMSSIAPTIVTDADGEVRLVAGAAGGSKILSVMTQILVRVLWFDQNIKQAIDAARFHHQLLPNVVEYEYGVTEGDILHLEKLLHKSERKRVGGTAVCGLEYVNQHIFGNADYRKDGAIAGY